MPALNNSRFNSAASALGRDELVELVDDTIKSGLAKIPAVVAPPEDPYALSTLPVTVAVSLTGPPATSITNGVLRKPKLVAGSTTVVDLANDECFQFTGTPSLTYGAASGGYAETPFHAGSQPAASVWWATARSWYDGQTLEVSVRAAVASRILFKLRVDGKYVTATAAGASGTVLTGGGENAHVITANSAGAIAAGGKYLIKIDFGSKALRHIEWEFDASQSFAGYFTEPASTLSRGNAPRTTLMVLGDSISAGAATYYRPDSWIRRTADLLGIDTVANGSVGGTGYINPGAQGGMDGRFKDRISDVVAINPDVLVIMGGQNETSSANIPLLQAEVENVIDLVKNDLPKTLIYVVGMWFPGQASADGAVQNTRVSLNDKIRAAAASRGVFFIDTIGNGKTSPAWAASTVYVNGQTVLHNTLPYTCVSAHTSAGTFDATKWQANTWINGTGKVGTTTAVGNSDTMIQADGVHPTAAGADLLERKIAAEMLRLARAASLS